MKDPHKHVWAILEFDGGWIEYCKICRDTRMADGIQQKCPVCEAHRRVYGNTKSALQCTACGGIFNLNVKSLIDAKK